MKITSYEPLTKEEEILKFWEEQKIYEKAKAKNKKGKQWYFLDGPPYTSGKVHIGTAWNKSLKDCACRYKRMTGFNVWDRAGYDMHGLPTAHKVMEKLGMESKDDIPKFGLKKFIQECINLSTENLKIMNVDFQRLGTWLDYENAYQSITPQFIEGVWWLIKKAHENNRLYEGEKVMHWCSHCSTALAKHELEYKNITDDSIFLKFKLKGKDEYLIIWTTTPWTIPFNLGVMVNPEKEYVKADVDGETWIIAKALAGVLISGVANKKFEIKEEFKGKDMEGWEYIHPLYDELKDIYDNLKKQSKNVHTVVLSKEYVDTSSGSGLVHMAPGCGPEDYEVGHKYGIPPFNNLDENGKFPKEMGKYAGWTAKKDDKKFIEDFEKKGFLIASTPVEHEYAHCWRCHNPVVFRTTKQWFFKVEDLIPKMRELNKNILWEPDWAGNRWFDSWLENLRDNSITRQRYWGTPLPIWRCDKCGNYEVIGSRKELEKHAKLPEDLHRPWIDEVSWKCNECTGEMKRISDILDVWVDAGTTSWNCLDYPSTEKNFKKLFPPDFILEGKDQIRGWFNLLFVASMVSMNKPSFKACYMHGFVNDSQGRKMSKSLGNYILPQEVIEKYGADTFRYYSIGGASAGLDLNYNFEDMKLKHRNLIVLWNIHKFIIDLANENNKNPNKLKFKNLGIKEKYIISRLNSTVKKATELFENYKIDKVPKVLEELWLDLSRVYIRLVRDKAALGTKEEKETIIAVVFNVIYETIKMFAPVAPFITEMMYKNLREAFDLNKISIHLEGWPSYNEKLIDEKLEGRFDVMGNILQAAFSAREKAGLSLRWPIKELVIVTSDELAVKAADELDEIIMEQANVKDIRVQESFPLIKEKVKTDFKKLKESFEPKIATKIIAAIATTSNETIMKHIEDEGAYKVKVDDKEYKITKNHLIIERSVPEQYSEAEFKGGFVYVNKERTAELDAEGYARELMRRIQNLRKKNGFNKTDKIKVHIKTDLADELINYEQMIKDKVGADIIKISEFKAAKKMEFESLEKIKQKGFDISFEKI